MIPRTSVEKVLERPSVRTRVVERGLFMGVMDNLQSQNPLWRPGSTRRDPTAVWGTGRFYQLGPFSWGRILGGEPVLVYEQLKREREHRATWEATKHTHIPHYL